MSRTSVVAFEVTCGAPDDMFLPWEEVSDDTKVLIDFAGPTNCDGGGNMGWWCIGCPYCGKYELIDTEEKDV